MSEHLADTAPGALVVDARFNGPPGSANGGYISGLLAGRLGPGPVEVTLRRPPPLDTPMRVDHDRAGGVRLLADGALVAEAATAAEPDRPPAAVSVDRAREAETRFRGRSEHPFPTCFVCGPDRAAGDGLRLFAGPVTEDTGDTVAAAWTPHPSLAESGRIPAELVWAALDCPAIWSSDIRGRPMVLGRMTAAVHRAPHPGRPYVVVGRLLGTEGRKAFTAAALFDADGAALGAARATWIRIRE